MPESDVQPIYVIKKKVSHGGHHGGAWKVAYADFVTAMMALFIVLWLLSSAEDVQKAVGGYFLDPAGKDKQTGSSQSGSGETLAVGASQMDKLKEKLEAAMKEMPEFATLKNQVAMSITGEGLRVELLETEHGMFFESGSPKPSEQGKLLLKTLAGQLSKMKNKVLIEGHTDAKPFPGSEYTNWELSTERANASRRFMQENGLRVDQVTQVRGFADQKLRVPKDPMDPSNRRISVIIQFNEAPPGAPPKPGEKAGEAKAGAQHKPEAKPHGE